MTVDIHRTARRHGIADVDIEHATTNATATEERDDEARLFIGPARAMADFWRPSRSTTATAPTVIHAMPMRPKYHRLLQGG